MPTLTLSSALVDVGADLQSVLETCLSREAATAIEAVRRAACTGARAALEAPPPALLHPCKFGSTSLLYGSVKPAPLSDVPYREGRWNVPTEGVCCVGGLIVSVAKNVSLPCIVYAQLGPQDEVNALFTFVPNVPLGHCEAELFNGSIDSATAFERLWVGDELVSQVSLRAHVGQYIRKCGLQKMPPWLLAGNYHIVRPGPLVFMRLRQPVNDIEVAAVKELLQSMPAPEKGVQCLQHLLSSNSGGHRECGVQLYTVFQRQCVPAREQQTSCAAATEQPILGALALGILNFASSDDYYDVGEENAPFIFGENDKGQCENGEDPLQERLNNLKNAEATMSVKQSSERERPKRERQMSDMFENCLRRVSMKCIGRPTQGDKVCVSVIDSLLECDIDKEIAKVTIAEKQRVGGSIEEQLCLVGSLLNARQGILIFSIAEDGRVQNITVAGKNVHQCNVDLDDANRVMLHPWLVPIIITKEHIFRPYIEGVQYEQLQLSNATHLRWTQRIGPMASTAPAELAAPEVPAVPAMPAAPPQVDLSGLGPALEALTSLPELVRKFDLLEQELRTLRESEHLNRRAHEQPHLHPPPVTPPSQQDSDHVNAVTGLKRALAVLEAEERAARAAALR